MMVCNTCGITCNKSPHHSNPMLHRRQLRPLHSHANSENIYSQSATASSLRQSRTHQHRTRERNVVVASCNPQAFDTGGRNKGRLPTQGESVVLGPGGTETMLQDLPKPPADIDYLAVSQHAATQLLLSCILLVLQMHKPIAATMQELIAVQQSGPKDIGFFGTRNMGFLHQNLIEVLSYAMVLTVSHASAPCCQ